MLVETVWNGTDGAHRSYHDVLNHSNVNVGITAHHRHVVARGNIFIDVHRVGEGALSLHVESIFKVDEFLVVRAVDHARHSAAASGSGYIARKLSNSEPLIMLSFSPAWSAMSSV